jgi:hypothetical protein
METVSNILIEPACSDNDLAWQFSTGDKHVAMWNIADSRGESSTAETGPRSTAQEDRCLQVS